MARTWLSIRVDLVDGAHAPELWPRPGDTKTTLSRLRLGDQFVFEFDFGDSWMHLCTVADEKVDPHEVYGEAADRPVPYWGWERIPDQYGRRWDGDNGTSAVPPPPEPPLSDLPDLHYWGSNAIPTSAPGAAAGEAVGEVVVGPWTDTDRHPVPPEPTPWTYEAIQDLRAAVAQRDAVRVVDLVARRDALDVAHVAAPGLIHALEVGHDPARAVLARLVPRLEERGWLGDDELVEEFERVASGEVGRLRPIPVDLEQLAWELDGPADFDEGSVLEIAIGRLWPRDPVGMAGLDEPEDFHDPDAFLSIVALGSGPGYGDMRDFIGAVTDDALAERLDMAIQGKGAFRRFKDTLAPNEKWWGAWLTFSNERQLGRARWWLADEGLRPTTSADA